MPLPLLDPLFLALAITSILVSGISKGGFGGGLGILAVPLLALTVSPVEVAAIVAPLLCGMDLVGLRAYWGKWDKRLLLLMIPGAFLGMALAGLLFGMITESGMRLFLGIIATVFALHYWSSNLMGRFSPVIKSWMGPFAGVLSGFTSFVAHAGGPPVQVFLLGLKPDKTVYVATTVGLEPAHTPQHAKAMHALKGKNTMQTSFTEMVGAAGPRPGFTTFAAIHSATLGSELTDLTPALETTGARSLAGHASESAQSGAGCALTFYLCINKAN